MLQQAAGARLRTREGSCCASSTTSSSGESPPPVELQTVVPFATSPRALAVMHKKTHTPAPLRPTG